MSVLMLGSSNHIWSTIFVAILLSLTLFVSFLPFILHSIYGVSYDKSLSNVFLPNENIYSIVLDGPQNSGKSSLYHRLLNPAESFMGLQESPGTKTNMKVTEEWPIAWRKGSGRREILCLRLIDTPGDHAELVVNALKLVEGPISQRVSNIVIMVISADDLDIIDSRMSKTYLQSTYKSNIRDFRILGVIVYVNKMDVVYEKNSNYQAVIGTINAKICGKNKLIDNLKEIFPQNRVRLVFGSVKTEEGLVSLMGQIFQLADIVDEAEHVHSSDEPLMLLSDDSSRIVIEEITNNTSTNNRNEKRKNT